MNEPTFMKMTELTTGIIYLINHNDIMYFYYDPEHDYCRVVLRDEGVLEVNPKVLNQFKKIRKEKTK